MPLFDTLLSAPWQFLLREHDYSELESRVEQAYATTEVYPPKNDLFAALRLTPPEAVRVVILGQDPYHEPEQAHGLCFSVHNTVQRPPSLNNIFKEMASDIDVHVPPGVNELTPWAQQGILLLNTTLTVRAHAAMSHAAFGWEVFTGHIIRALLQRPNPILFVLWGNHAKQFAPAIAAAPQHETLISAHPSPLSASRGFFGSQPFSRINLFLYQNGYDPIVWDLA